jgi:uncharacterized protein (TIGR03435 family)
LGVCKPHMRVIKFQIRGVLSVLAAVAVVLAIQVGVIDAIPSPTQADSPRRQFAVASIRHNDGNETERYIRPSPGRLLIRNMNVKNLLTTAYGLMTFQVTGGPSWIESENYDIQATSDDVVPLRQMTGPMLQSLLEQRFKLSAHREIKEHSVYVLTVQGRGSNLQASAEPTCVPADPSSPVLPGAPNRNGELCGSIGLGLASLTGKQVTMPALAMALSHLLGRTVIDRTNLAGEFDARVTFAPPGYVPNGAVVDPTLPDIFFAVREQLGLKLESSNEPIEMFVIDHVERPSEN